MRHGWRIAFAVCTAAILVLVGVVPLTWGGTPHTTFYTSAEVKLAASRAGLRIVGIASFPIPSHVLISEYERRVYIFRSRGEIRRGRSHIPLFFIDVVERQPNLDRTWNRRLLRGAIKDWTWYAAHFPKRFHVRRANVAVIGLRGLSAELREQLIRTIRSLPDHGDPTVDGSE